MPVLTHDFDSIDIRLLIVFRAVVFTGSLSKAARKLNVTPSAVSQSLTKLGKYFNHPLFTRTSTGLEPTDYAMELYNYVNAALDLLQDGVESLSDFDPATSKRRFRIAANHVLDLEMLHPLAKHIEVLNSQLSLSIYGLIEEDSRIIDSLQIDNNDVCLVTSKLSMASIKQELLYSTELIALAREGHPAQNKEIDRDAFVSLRHFRYAPGQIGVFERMQHAKVDDRDVIMDTNNPFNAMMMAQESDGVVVISKWLWEHYGSQFNLAPLNISFELPKIPLYLTYLAKLEESKANRWLRAQIKELVANIR